MRHTEPPAAFGFRWFVVTKRSTQKMNSPHKEKMIAFVSELACEFPHLRFEMDAGHKDVDFYSEFPIQENLSFTIGVALDYDLLSLYVGALWLEYFPVTDVSVLESFSTALRGLLLGTYRVVEYASGNSSPHKAVLQYRENGHWQACGRSSRFHLPSFRPTHERVLIRVEPCDTSNPLTPLAQGADGR